MIKQPTYLTRDFTTLAPFGAREWAKVVAGQNPSLRHQETSPLHNTPVIQSKHQSVSGCHRVISRSDWAVIGTSFRSVDENLTAPASVPTCRCVPDRRPVVQLRLLPAHAPTGGTCNGQTVTPRFLEEQSFLPRTGQLDR